MSYYSKESKRIRQCNQFRTYCFSWRFISLFLTEFKESKDRTFSISVGNLAPQKCAMSMSFNTRLLTNLVDLTIVSELSLDSNRKGDYQYPILIYQLINLNFHPLGYRNQYLIWFSPWTFQCQAESNAWIFLFHKQSKQY